MVQVQRMNPVVPTAPTRLSPDPGWSPTTSDFALHTPPPASSTMPSTIPSTSTGTAMPDYFALSPLILGNCAFTHPEADASLITAFDDAYHWTISAVTRSREVLYSGSGPSLGDAYDSLHKETSRAVSRLIATRKSSGSPPHARGGRSRATRTRPAPCLLDEDEGFLCAVNAADDDFSPGGESSDSSEDEDSRAGFGASLVSRSSHTYRRSQAGRVARTRTRIIPPRRAASPPPRPAPSSSAPAPPPPPPPPPFSPAPVAATMATPITEQITLLPPPASPPLAFRGLPRYRPSPPSPPPPPPPPPPHPQPTRLTSTSSSLTIGDAITSTTPEILPARFIVNEPGNPTPYKLLTRVAPSMRAVQEEALRIVRRGAPKDPKSPGTWYPPSLVVKRVVVTTPGNEEESYEIDTDFGDDLSAVFGRGSGGVVPRFVIDIRHPPTPMAETSWW